MKITLDWLRAKNACGEAVSRFQQEFGNEAEYQDVLDVLGRENNAGWALWLIQNAGHTKDVLEIKGDLVTETSLFFSGFIKVTGRIAAKFLISGTGIKAGWGIEAGESIKAGEGIEAGEYWGIYAGLRVSISLKSTYALIIAKTSPKNIVLGEYRKKEAAL